MWLLVFGSFNVAAQIDEPSTQGSVDNYQTSEPSSIQVEPAQETELPTPEPYRETATYTLQVDSGFIDLRTGPGRGYPVFHSLENGELLRFEKMRTDWIKVSFGRGDQQRSAWMHREQVSLLSRIDGGQLDFSEPSYDDYSKRRWYTGVGMGDFGGASSISLLAGYRLTANLSSELRLTQAIGEVSDSVTAQIAVTHQPFPAWRVSPYFVLGTGVINTSPDASIIETEDRQDTAMLAGVGVLTYLTRRMVLRAEYANHYLLTTREQNQEVSEWKLGLDIFF